MKGAVQMKKLKKKTLINFNKICFQNPNGKKSNTWTKWANAQAMKTIITN